MTDIKMLVAKDFMFASREGPNLIGPELVDHTVRETMAETVR